MQDTSFMALAEGRGIKPKRCNEQPESGIKNPDSGGGSSLASIAHRVKTEPFLTVGLLPRRWRAGAAAFFAAGLFAFAQARAADHFILTAVGAVGGLGG